MDAQGFARASATNMKEHWKSKDLAKAPFATTQTTGGSHLLNLRKANLKPSIKGLGGGKRNIVRAIAVIITTLNLFQQ